MKQYLLSALVVAAMLVPIPMQANYFDCSVVYDEFDQLMMAKFLEDPQRYVDTIPGSISRDEFLEFQQHRFKLREGREKTGIGIFLTNRNIRGKMTFLWNPSIRERQIPLEIDEAISFARVEDGTAPRRVTAIYLTPGFGVDLDTAAVVELDDESADLVYEFEDDKYLIRALPPAQLFFPVESMCHKIED